MNPLKKKKTLKENFKKNKDLNKQKILKFSDFKIEVKVDILKEYRENRGECF